MNSEFQTPPSKPLCNGPYNNKLVNAYLVYKGLSQFDLIIGIFQHVPLLRIPADTMYMKLDSLSDSQTNTMSGFSSYNMCTGFTIPM